MIEVSDAWRRNQEREITSKAYIKLTLDMQSYDLVMPEEINFKKNIYNTNPSGVFDTYEKFKNTKLALNNDDYYTILDGTFLYEEDYIRDYQEGFYAVPYDHYSFKFNYKDLEDRKTTVNGLTITFDDTLNYYPREFNIFVYNAKGTLVNKKTITNNKSPIVRVEMKIRDYNEIVIGMNEPIEKRNKQTIIRNITFGSKHTFTNDDIIKLSYKEKISPINTAIHKQELSFTVDALKNNFNPNDENSLYDYLAKKETLIYEVGYYNEDLKYIEYINKGIFYLTDFKVPTNGYEAVFKAENLFSFLNNNYEKAKKITNYKEYIRDVLKSARLKQKPNGDDKFILDIPLKNADVPYVPSLTLSENLLLGVNAVNGYLLTDKNGDIKVTNKLNTSIPYVIPDVQYFKNADVKTSRTVHDLIVKYYNYKEDREKALNTTVIKTTDLSDKIVVKYDGNYTDTQTVTIKVYNPLLFGWVDPPSGFVKSIEKYNNSTVINIDKTKLYAYHQEVKVDITVKELSITALNYTLNNSSEGDDIVVNNPLITTYQDAKSVANHMLKTLHNQNLYIQELRIDPKIEVLDKVVIKDGQGENKEIVVTEIDYSFNGMFKGKIKGREM